MPVRPISPSEVVEKKPEIPDGVIEVFNNLILEKFKDGRAIVYRKHALSAIAIRTHLSKEKVIDNSWLDVADIFRSAGWDVKVINNTAPGEEHFIFIKKGT